MEGNKPLRVGIVGGGQIAGIHLSHLARLQVGTLVAICDIDRGQAEKAAQTFKIPNVYTNFDEMLSSQRPDVVHVVTPPSTHAALSIQAMRAGAHVLVEKPMAMSVEEADQMIAVARETGKVLCVDHNRLFSPATLEARRFLESGELGQLISVEFFQGYVLAPHLTVFDLKRQWQARLPGGLVQDMAPHGLSFLLEFVGTPKRVHVLSKTTGLLPVAPAEEVRVIVEGERILGALTVSLSIQPFMNYCILFGSKMTVQVNLTNFTTLVRKDRLPHPLLQRALGGFDEGWQLAYGGLRNAVRFARGKLPRYPDIAEVISRFYRSLRDATPPPVSAEQGREVVRLIGEIVETMEARKPAAQPRSFAFRASEPVRVLVTGGTGFLGSALVRRLLSQGVRPRVLARPSLIAEELEQMGAEIISGNLLNERAVCLALHGIETVFHCAARMGSQGTWQQFLDDNVEGTRNVLKAAREQGVQQFVYLSSLGVYGMPTGGNPITEESPYDADPEKRGHYSHSKILAEKLVIEFEKETGLPVTIFRPGIIFGNGRVLPTAPLAFRFGQTFMVIGSSRYLLPLNYIENLIDAMLMAVGRQDCIHQAFNIVDEEKLTSGQFHRARSLADQTRAVFIPPLPFRMAAPGIELWAGKRGGGKLASFSSYALARVLTSVRFDSRRVRQQLGWQPGTALQDALKASIS